MIMLRTPQRDELSDLSELCMMSKAYWGYDEEFMQACREELTIEEDDLEHCETVVAEENGKLLGVAKIELIENDEAELDLLYVHPDAIGKGIGRHLFDWSTRTARAIGARRLKIDADPNALGFYETMGGKLTGTSPSGSIPGRELPQLMVTL